jgi:hypothetical protein
LTSAIWEVFREKIWEVNRIGSMPVTGSAVW